MYVTVLFSSMQTPQSRGWVERSMPTSFTGLLSFLQLPRLQEHRVEHGFGEDTSEGVLLGGMVATKEGDTGRRYVPGAVGELGLGFRAVHPQGGVPGEGAETDDSLYGGEQFELADGVWEASVAFFGGGFVLRWGATD